MAFVVLTRRRVHELQVVEDDDGFFLIVEHTARLGADLGDRRTRGVVDQDVQTPQLVDGLVDVDPLLGRDAARAEVGHVHHGLGANEALRDFFAGHLQGEEAHRVPVCGGVEGQVQSERGLTNGGTGADDHELALAQAHEHAIERRIARGRTMDVAAGARDLLGFLIRLGHKVAEFAIRALHLSRRNGEQHGLGALDDLFRVDRGVVGQSADLIGRPDDLTQHGVTTDDAGMVLPVGKRERVSHELEDIPMSSRTYASPPTASSLSMEFR